MFIALVGATIGFVSEFDENIGLRQQLNNKIEQLDDQIAVQQQLTKNLNACTARLEGANISMAKATEIMDKAAITLRRCAGAN